MKVMRAWKFRLYPSKVQQRGLSGYLHECKNLWNSLLEYTKKCYEETGKFPNRKQLYLLTKDASLYSQVAQNVADRLSKSLKGVIVRKMAGQKAGFPRFKPLERVKSFTYPQFGFKLDERLELSGMASISIKKHRQMQGEVKTLTIKKSPSGKWFALFTTEAELPDPCRKTGPKAGIDLGVEHFACLSDGEAIENPRHIRQAEERLKEAHQQLSRKKKRSKNRQKAKHRLAVVSKNSQTGGAISSIKPAGNWLTHILLLHWKTSTLPAWRKVSLQNPCWIAVGRSSSA
jgi:putative transposase